MSERIWVATRKGLFRVDKMGSGEWRVRKPSFLGQPVTMVMPDERNGRVWAALNLGHFGIKMHVSDDQGETWSEKDAPAFPKVEDGSEEERKKAPSVEQIWCLESGGADREGRLWAGTIPGGLFRSDDDGESWSLVESLWDRPEREQWFGGGYDSPGIHSIVVDPRDSDRVLLGISCGGVWLTGNAGESWELMAAGMFAEYMPPDRREDQAIQDPHRLVQCPAEPDHLWVQHHNGIFRSTDGAKTWQEVPAGVPSVFGFTVAVHPEDPLRAWFVPAVKDECRVPVDGAVVVSTTTDGGETFEVLREGLPQENAWDLVFRHALDVDRTGRLLAMGSTTGGFWISEEEGHHWTPLSLHLPPIYAVRFG